MSKALKIVLPLAGTAAAVIGATAFLIAPGIANKRQKAPFQGRNFAHRGLHKYDKSIPENSLPAFQAAVDNGYGMELDVQLSADDQVVVFHDDSLERVCGEEGDVTDRTWAELSALKLCGTKERMPLLTEVFSVVGGREPIIIELKRGMRNEELCQKTLDLIDAYKGPVCVESFDPLIVRWFRLNAPDILRGQLSALQEDMSRVTTRHNAFLLGNLLTNFIGRPQFIAYKIGKKPFTVRLCEAMGAMKIAWTSWDWASEDTNDAVIFEYYRPRRRFK
jgi:Glycerophosphoryl diester phosphodiesterase